MRPRPDPPRSLRRPLRPRPWQVALVLALLLTGGPVLVRSLLESARDGDRSGHAARSADERANASGAGRDGGAPGDRGGGDPTSDTPEPRRSASPGDGDAASVRTAPELDEGPAPPRYAVSGTVVGADGRALGGAEVELFLHRAESSPDGAFERLIRGLDALEDSGSPAGRTTSDRSGRFTIEVASPGEYRLGASLAPLARGVEGPFRLTDRDPVVDLLVVLGGGLSLSGFVVGPDGRPVGGAEIALLDRLEGEIPGRHYHAHRAISASDGSFVVDGLEARRYILTAVASGFARTLLPSISPPQDDLLVSVSAGRHLAIRVVRGRAAAPLELGPGGTIVPLPVPGDPVEGSGEPVPGAQVYALNPVGFAVATTDEGGIARLSLPGDDVSLRITAPGFRERRVRRLTIPTGVVAEPTEVTLEPVEPIEGRVVYSDDTPAAHAEILEVEGGLLGGGLRNFRADAEGRFTYRGSGALLARSEGEVSGFPDGAAGTTPTLSLRPSEIRAGRVVRPDGWPAAGAEIRLGLRRYFGGGGETILRWLGADTVAVAASDGTFALAGIPPWGNELELVVQYAGSPDRRIPATADLGEIVLGEEATLEGRLVVPGGAPPPSAALVLELPGATPVRRDPASGTLRGGERVLVAEDGRFWIDRLAPTAADEPLVLHVVAPPYLEETRTVTLAPGPNGPLRIDLQEGGAVRVFVEGGDGAPRPAAQVVLTRGSGDGGGTRLARTGPDGVAYLAGLPPATYAVSVDAGSEDGATTVEVSAGFTTELTITVD